MRAPCRAPAAQAALLGNRYQVLLGAIVDIAFEPTPLGILRGHDALA